MAKKRRFVVKPRTPFVMENGLSTTKGNVGFGGKTQKILTDESLAREIDTEYGVNGKRDVYVYEDDRLEWHDANDKETDGMNHDKGGHRYFFGALDLSKPGGNERVLVKTRDGYSIMSRVLAEEEGLQIVKRRKHNGKRQAQG